MTRKIDVALVYGDGSAPEMMRCAVKVVDKAAADNGVQINWVLTPMGWVAYDKFGDTLPKESLETVKRLGILFFGGVGDTKRENTTDHMLKKMRPEGRCLLTIRQVMGFSRNTRPVIFYPELRGIAMVRPETIPDAGVRQVWLRLLLEEDYYGNRDLKQEVPEEVRRRLGILEKHEVTGKEPIVTDLAYLRRSTILGHLQYAFALARQLSKPIISIDKANVVPRSILWRAVCEEVAKEFPDVSVRHVYADDACQLLFTPAALDGVLPCANVFGDILSDGANRAAGSLGLMHSSAVNPQTGAAMFESGAGTYPQAEGKNIANPIGRIRAGAMMLRHVGVSEAASAIEDAVQKVLCAGYRMQDIMRDGDNPGKFLGTSQMGDKIIEAMNSRS